MLLEEHLVDPAPAAESRPPAASLARTTGDGEIPTLDEVERAHIERVFAMTKGHKGRTCRILGISRPTLERKLRKYRLTAITD
jgi:two-component system response regulator AtoC